MRRRVLSFCASTLCLLALAGCSGGSKSTSTPTSPVTPADNPAPTITGVSPQSVVAGSPGLTITISGTGYIASTSATLNGVALQATYVNSTTLQATVPATAIAGGQVADLVVANPSPGGGSSAAAKFSIMSPTPAITGLSPRSVPQGGTATITVTGSGFEANSVVLYNGSERPTTFVNSTTLQVALTANDLKSFGSGEISVNNPGPGGSTTTPTQLVVAATTPTITYVSPTSIPVSSSNVPTTISISGSGFAANATVQANGTFLPVSTQSGTYISASLAPSFFVAAGTIQIVVSNPGTPAVQSNAVTITVPAPTLTLTVSPNSVPAGSPDTKITLNGSGFYQDSVVKWNDVSLATTFVNSRQLTAIVPAPLISGFAQASIQVVTPETQGGPQLPPQPFTTYLALPTNDIVYNPADGLIYASIPGSTGGGLGNTVAAIDPNSGAITKTILVGSEPNRIALSSDGTQLFVGLNGAGAVRQVNLTTATAGTQFSLGGGPGMYNPPYTAQGLAVLPGQPNSVAVYSSNGVVTVYDSGVARSKTSTGLSVYFNSNYGSLSFGSSASTLYLNSQSTGTNLYALTIDSTGVTAATNLGPGGGYGYANGNSLQYDNNRLYLTSGAVMDASTGAQLGQFSVAPSPGYGTSPVNAAGPMVSDSALGRAWVLPTTYSSSYSYTQIVAYDETTFNPVGGIPITGISSSTSSTPMDMIRWGQNGLAFHTSTQLYVLQSPLVKDLSSSPADLAVSIQAGSTATTGTGFTYTIKVANLGQNSASGVVLTTALPGNVTGASFTASQGSCSGAPTLYCDLGTLATGSSATLTITVTPTTAGTMALTGYSDSTSLDPTTSNNQATASVTVTGNAYNAAPYITQLSPSMIQAGSASSILTVDGAGFTSGSSILWNGQAIPTTFVSAGQLTAMVDPSLIAQLGWAKISVSTPTPGGGLSAALPLHIYQMLNVPANAISFDPFTQKLYAVLPSTSTAITGNSLVAINPFTGDVGSPIQVGSEPNLLAETSDGQYMYIGLSGAKSLGKFNLNSQSIEATIPIVYTGPFDSAAPAAAVTMATVPGTTNSLAINTSSNDWNGIGIFDITGNTGAFRSKFPSPYSGHAAVFSDPTHFYAYDSATTGAEFYRYSIDSTGVKQIDATTLNGIGGFNGTFQIDNGLIFGGYGGIIDPSTTPPSQLAVMPVSSSSGTNIGGVVSYQAESKAFFIGGGSGSGFFLRRFDTTTFRQDEQLQLPTLAYDAWSGVRFGQDGLAILASPSYYSSPSQPIQVLLLRGPFVVPAEGTTNQTPTLTSASQSTITAGSGNLILTLTGSGFMPGATATWNGSGRTTTFVDSTHVQVAVPAADLATGQTVTLKVSNPGSGDSNSVSVLVQ